VRELSKTCPQKILVRRKTKGEGDDANVHPQNCTILSFNKSYSPF
jgi:hypothetical protein